VAPFTANGDPGILVSDPSAATLYPLICVLALPGVKESNPGLYVEKYRNATGEEEPVLVWVEAVSVKVATPHSTTAQADRTTIFMELSRGEVKVRR